MIPRGKEGDYLVEIEVDGVFSHRKFTGEHASAKADTYAANMKAKASYIRIFRWDGWHSVAFITGDLNGKVHTNRR